jgi:hypothetical protein
VGALTTDAGELKADAVSTTQTLEAISLASGQSSNKPLPELKRSELQPPPQDKCREQFQRARP